MTDLDQAERIRRLQERRAAGRRGPTVDPETDTTGRPTAIQERTAGGDDGTTPAVSRRRHPAAASRIGAAGLGATLTLSLVGGISLTDITPASSETTEPGLDHHIGAGRPGPHLTHGSPFHRNRRLGKLDRTARGRGSGWNRCKRGLVQNGLGDRHIRHPVRQPLPIPGGPQAVGAQALVGRPRTLRFPTLLIRSEHPAGRNPAR